MNNHQLETIALIMNNAKNPMPALEMELSSATNEFVDEDSAFEACDRMYSMLLRSEDMEIDFDDSELLDDLGDSLAEHLYMIKHNISAPPSFDTDDERTHDNAMYFYECVADFALTIDIQKLLKDQKYFTYLCNYKGEGEGRPVISVTVKNLRQFIEKNTSFYQAQH